MATLTLTKGMDQTVKLELADEKGNVESVVGPLTLSIFRVFESLSSISPVLTVRDPQVGFDTILVHALSNGAVIFPVSASALSAVTASSYFGQWSGVINGKSYTTAVFDVVVEPKVI